MTLTVADIERWNSEAVRDVFHAATARAQSAQTASRELGALAVFDDWEGEASTAARHAIAQTRQDLDAHGNEALVVGRAARQAADDIDSVQAQLRDLKSRAAESGLEVDPASNRIVPIPHSTHGRREMQQKIPGLQAQLDGIRRQTGRKGRRLVKRYEEIRAARLSPVVEGFGRNEVARFTDLLERFSVSLLGLDPPEERFGMRCAAFIEADCPVGEMRGCCPCGTNRHRPGRREVAEKVS